MFKIVISIFVMLSFGSCSIQNKEKAFLVKYEFEDFSQFNGVHVFIRGVDKKRNPIIFLNAPHLVNDSSKVGLYVVTLDKKNYQIISTKWTQAEHDVNANTIQLQQLALTFINYGIPRLIVDEQGNVIVYLKDLETISLVRFENGNEFLKDSTRKWENIKGNWYIPK